MIPNSNSDHINYAYVRDPANNARVVTIAWMKCSDVEPDDDPAIRYAIAVNKLVGPRRNPELQIPVDKHCKRIARMVAGGRLKSGDCRIAFVKQGGDPIETAMRHFISKEGCEHKPYKTEIGVFRRWFEAKECKSANDDVRKLDETSRPVGHCETCKFWDENPEHLVEGRRPCRLIGVPGYLDLDCNFYSSVGVEMQADICELNGYHSYDNCLWTCEKFGCVLYESSIPSFDADLDRFRCSEMQVSNVDLPSSSPVEDGSLPFQQASDDSGNIERRIESIERIVETILAKLSKRTPKTTRTITAKLVSRINAKPNPIF